MSGPELQNRLTELGCRVPVISITGHGDIPTSVQAIKSGAKDLLTEPVTKEELIEVIERALTPTKVLASRLLWVPRSAQRFLG